MGNIDKTKKMILIVILIAIYGVAWYMLAWEPSDSKIASIDKEIQKKEPELQKLEADYANRNELEENKKVLEIRSDQMSNYLTAKANTTEGTDFIQKMARILYHNLYNIVVSEPEIAKDVFKKVLGKGSIAPSFYAMKIKFNSVMTYPEILGLNRFLEGSSKLVTVSEFQIKPVSMFDKKGNKIYPEQFNDVSYVLVFYSIDKGSIDRFYEYSRSYLSHTKDNNSISAINPKIEPKNDGNKVVGKGSSQKIDIGLNVKNPGNSGVYAPENTSHFYADNSQNNTAGSNNSESANKTNIGSGNSKYVSTNKGNDNSNFSAGSEGNTVTNKDDNWQKYVGTGSGNEYYADNGYGNSSVSGGSNTISEQGKQMDLNSFRLRFMSFLNPDNNFQFLDLRYPKRSIIFRTKSKTELELKFDKGMYSISVDDNANNAKTSRGEMQDGDITIDTFSDIESLAFARKNGIVVDENKDLYLTVSIENNSGRKIIITLTDKNKRILFNDRKGKRITGGSNGEKVYFN